MRTKCKVFLKLYSIVTGGTNRVDSRMKLERSLSGSTWHTSFRDRPLPDRKETVLIVSRLMVSPSRIEKFGSPLHLYTLRSNIILVMMSYSMYNRASLSHTGLRAFDHCCLGAESTGVMIRLVPDARWAWCCSTGDGTLARQTDVPAVMPTDTTSCRVVAPFSRDFFRTTLNGFYFKFEYSFNNALLSIYIKI